MGHTVPASSGRSPISRTPHGGCVSWRKIARAMQRSVEGQRLTWNLASAQRLWEGSSKPGCGTSAGQRAAARAVRADMRTTLHIGVEKTGTTTIQAFLDRNRRSLQSDQRIVVTRRFGIGNSRDLATYAIRDDYFNDDHLMELEIATVEAKREFKAQVSMELSRLVAESARSDRLVLSSEHFQSRLKSVAEVAGLRVLLDANGFSVDSVIVYMRDPAEVIQSMYSTALRGGAAVETPASADNPHWNHICDYRATIERWCSGFPNSV